jgi:hypothetical protein
MKLLGLVVLALLPGAQDKKPPGEFAATLMHALGGPARGDWQPYVLEMVNNLGREVDARIRIEEEGSRTSVTRREPLAAGVKKRLFFYLPLGVHGAFGGGFQVRYAITDRSGKVVAQGTPVQSYSAAGLQALQVGLLSSDTASPGAFRLPQQSGNQEVQVFRLMPETFPDRWIGLAPLDVLILHDAPVDQLTAEQAQALVDWVRQGGTVVLSPGQQKGIFSLPAIAAIAKIRVGEPELVTEIPRLARAYGPFPGRDRFLRYPVEGGAPFIPGEAAPEIPAFASGFGRAVVLPFDVRKAPFTAWEPLEQLWSAVFAAARAPEAASPPMSQHLGRQSVFRTMAAFINPYPSFVLLAALAILFLLAVGPVNYLALRRLRMTLLLVVTVPAISLGFLGMVLAVGYVLKGTSTVAYSVRLLSTRSGLSCARERHLFTLFAPTTRTYDVSLDPPTWALPLDRALDPQANATRGLQVREGPAERVEFQEGPARGYRDVAVGQWQSWNLEGRALRDLKDGITFKETARGRLRVANGSPHAIRRGVYVVAGYGGYASAFGAVPAGGSVEVAVDEGRYEPVADLGFERESFGGRLLTPYFAPLPTLYRQREAARGRQHRFLVCLLEDGTPPVSVNARLSGSGRSLVLLHVLEEAP